MNHKLIALSLHSHHHLRSYPSSCLGNATSLAQQNANPRIEFQSPLWGPVLDQAKSFIRRLPALDLLHRPTAHGVYTTLGLPLLPPPSHHPTLISLLPLRLDS